LGKPDEVVGKDSLFDAVWPGLVVEENTLQVHISALRKALPPSGG
jgi:DNA-binding winged helix-turn-helix (wHTH) protein